MTGAQFEISIDGVRTYRDQQELSSCAFGGDLHMRTPPMGMSGVQVLGTGVEGGGVAEGRHKSMRCIGHGKRGRLLAAPSHPRLPPPATYTRSLLGD